PVSRRSKPSSRSLLVGEQSNAWRILLRYDRKSRHRRIKKRRRYERLAATSQFLATYRPKIRSAFALLSYAAGRRDTLSGGSSPYLKQEGEGESAPPFL